MVKSAPNAFVFLGVSVSSYVLLCVDFVLCVCVCLLICVLAWLVMFGLFMCVSVCLFLFRLVISVGRCVVVCWRVARSVCLRVRSLFRFLYVGMRASLVFLSVSVYFGVLLCVVSSFVFVCVGLCLGVLVRVFVFCVCVCVFVFWFVLPRFFVLRCASVCFGLCWFASLCVDMCWRVLACVRVLRCMLCVFVFVSLLFGDVGCVMVHVVACLFVFASCFCYQHVSSLCYLCFRLGVLCCVLGVLLFPCLFQYELFRVFVFWCVLVVWGVVVKLRGILGVGCMRLVCLFV